jgi:anti-anti-sigma factor
MSAHLPPSHLPPSQTDAGSDARTARSRFTVQRADRDGVAVLLLSGELDQDAAPLLAAALAEPVAGQAGRALVVDCSLLTFCDSSGLNALLTARLKARRASVDLYLAAVRDPVARMFAVTGADTVFTVRPDLEAALAAVHGTAASG